MTDALKGHAMKRGTTMVLKRFFSALLGALGLSALVAGSAFGQTEGNVPAPDGFNAHLECAGNASAVEVYKPTEGTGPRKTGPSTLDGLLMDAWMPTGRSPV